MALHAGKDLSLFDANPAFNHKINTCCTAGTEVELSTRKLKAGHHGRNLCRRRRAATLVLVKPHRTVRYRYLDFDWLQVSKLDGLHVVFSRKGLGCRILGLVTDASEVSAAGLIQAYDRRWKIEQFFKDSQQLLGLGHTQNRPYRAVVIHLHLACFASALMTHWRIAQTRVTRLRTCRLLPLKTNSEV